MCHAPDASDVHTLSFVCDVVVPGSVGTGQAIGVKGLANRVASASSKPSRDGMPSACPETNKTAMSGRTVLSCSESSGPSRENGSLLVDWSAVSGHSVSVRTGAISMRPAERRRLGCRSR